MNSSKPAAQASTPSTPLWDEQTAEWYVAKWGDHPTNHQTVALAQLQPEDVVLDIGCGSGTAVREAAKYVTRGRVIGVDPTPTMIRHARQKSKSLLETERVAFELAGAEGLPFDDGSMTVVLSINSIHHWQDVVKGVAEVYRVLANNGRLLISAEIFEEEGRGLDPAYTMNLLEQAGFVQIALSQHQVGDEQMILLQALKA